MKNVSPARHWSSLLPWLAAALVALVIFLLSAQPHSSDFTRTIFGEYNGLARQGAHMAEFAVLFLCLRWALGRVLSGRLAPLVVAVALACGWACLDEWHQSFVPGRTSAIAHVLTDVRGIAVGVVVWLVGSAVYAGRRVRHPFDE